MITFTHFADAFIQSHFHCIGFTTVVGIASADLFRLSCRNQRREVRNWGTQTRNEERIRERSECKRTSGSWRTHMERGSLSGSRLLRPILSESGINISSACPAFHWLWLSCTGCFWLRLNHLSKWGVHLRERLHHLEKITALGAEETLALGLKEDPCLLVPVLSGDVFLCFFYSRTNKTQCSFIALVSVTLWALEATQAPSLGRTNPQVCTSSCSSPFQKHFYSSLNPFVFPHLFFMLLYFLQK